MLGPNKVIAFGQLKYLILYCQDLHLIHQGIALMVQLNNDLWHPKHENLRGKFHQTKVNWRMVQQGISYLNVSFVDPNSLESSPRIRMNPVAQALSVTGLYSTVKLQYQPCQW